MPNKRIQDLPKVDRLTSGDVLPLGRASASYDAYGVTGQQLTDFIKTEAQTFVDAAEQAATEAESFKTAASQFAAQANDAKDAADLAKTGAETAKSSAESAQAAAEESRQAIENMTVSAQEVGSDEPVAVQKTIVDGVVNLLFSLKAGPTGQQGPKGDPGSSIQKIERTSGTGAPGTTDTYTITLTDGSTFTFTVYNGANGEGAGDMVAAIYDPTGKATDIYAYANGKINEHNTSPDAHSDLFSEKVGVVSPATEGNIATLTADGQLQDSGKSITDIASGGGVPVVTLSSTDGENFYGEVDGFDPSYGIIFVGVPNMTATKSLVSVYINNNYIGNVARITLYSDGTSGTAANGPEMLVKDKPVFLQTSPEYPGRLITSGFSQRTINDNSPTQGSKKFLSSGAVYTALQGKVSTVSSATAGNVATFAEGGQLQDSGKSLDDLGNNDFVVTITGSSAEGPFTADQQYADIVAAIAAGKNVFASWDAGSKKYPCIPLTVSPGSSNPSGTLAFTTFDLSYGVGPVAFTISSANAVTGFIQSQHTHTSANITDTIPVEKGGTGVTSLTGTDYTTNRVRGMALLPSAPDTIPNGCIVGVYS